VRLTGRAAAAPRADTWRMLLLLLLLRAHLASISRKHATPASASAAYYTVTPCPKKPPPFGCV